MPGTFARPPVSCQPRGEDQSSRRRAHKSQHKTVWLLAELEPGPGCGVPGPHESTTPDTWPWTSPSRACWGGMPHLRLRSNSSKAPPAWVARVGVQRAQRGGVHVQGGQPGVAVHQQRLQPLRRDADLRQGGAACARRLGVLRAWNAAMLTCAGRKSQCTRHAADAMQDLNCPSPGFLSKPSDITAGRAWVCKGRARGRTTDVQHAQRAGGGQLEHHPGQAGEAVQGQRLQGALRAGSRVQDSVVSPGCRGLGSGGSNRTGSEIGGGGRCAARAQSQAPRV